ncbi:hypothetical protein [Sphingomonas profundi]|uniref:hypothetical protein n=1 Tax=Alterirhizorhabdus profundi TaxID=2681549 RepID=UPI0018D02F95|nr:hypothetical protein [Sphingomonas profundi]
MPGHGAEVKPEALVPLDATDRRFAGLLLFDGPINGDPTLLIVDFADPTKRGEGVSTVCEPEAARTSGASSG